MLSCIHFTCYHFSLVTSVDNIKSSVFPFICNICRTLLCLNKENSMEHSDFGKFCFLSLHIQVMIVSCLILELMIFYLSVWHTSQISLVT